MSGASAVRLIADTDAPTLRTGTAAGTRHSADLDLAVHSSSRSAH